LPATGPTNAAFRDWNIKLHRRVSGRFLLQVQYSQALNAGATNARIAGIQVQDVNLQRGFLTVHSGNRLQLRIEAQPNALQPTDAQAVPRALQQDLKP